VVVFATAFIAVICLKILAEWRDLETDAELRQARAAAFLAERTATRLARAQGSAATTAAGIEAAAGVDADTAAMLLAALTAGPQVRAAALLTDTGDIIETTGGADGARFARAIGRRVTAPTWVDREDGATTRIFTSSTLILGDQPMVLVAELDPAAIAPTVAEHQILALTDGVGEVLTSNGAADAPSVGALAANVFGVDMATVAEVRQTAGGAIAVDGRAGQPGVLGLAPVAGTDLTVVLAGPRVLDDALWRNTLFFYLLLLAAPILVAVGLCAVLLMQMENIRQARVALQDQERRFRLAIEGARCGVWDWNLADDTVFITDSLARMIGRKGSSTMKGSEFLSLVRTQDQEPLAQAIRNAPNVGEIDIEFRAYSRPVWLQARGRPWTGAGDTPSARIVGVAIDITEQKGDAARATAAETRLRAALESMSECFVLWDARRRLVLSNQKYREFFHLDSKLVKPGAAYEMLDLAAQGAIKDTHASSEDGARELELADGRWLHFSERRTNDGGLVSIGTDITALKRQEEQLVDSEKQARRMVADLRESQDRIAELARSYEQEKIRAEEANHSKSEFLANMSHELRTPLNAINGFSEIMTAEMFGPLGDDRYKEYASDILTSGQLLLELINDILDMSKIEAGKMKLSIENIFPDEIAEQCVRLVRGKAREAALDLVMNIGDLPEIKADPRALKQVILNLLTNAIKFTPEGGRVEIEGRPVPEGIRIRVIDSGIGISEKDLPRIGKPFEQIESQQSKAHAGSGLGLALARSLVEMHGGTFTLESEVDKGTTVTLVLPMRPTVTDTDDTDSQISALPPLTGASPPPKKTPGQTPGQGPGKAPGQAPNLSRDLSDDATAESEAEADDKRIPTPV